MSPFESIFRQQRELSRALNTLKPAIVDLRAISQPLRVSIAHLEALRRQFTLPADILRLQKSISLTDTFNTLSSINSINSPAIKAFQAQQARMSELSKLLATHHANIGAFSRAVFDSAATTEAMLRLSRIAPSSASIALGPQIAFQEFAEKYLNVAKAKEGIAQQNRLRIVEAGSNLLPSISSGFELASIMKPPSLQFDDSNELDVNVYTSLDGELSGVDLDDSAAEPELLVGSSQSSQIAELGAKIVEVVYNLNTECERNGKPSIFTPTTKALLACATISRRVTDSLDSFNEIVDSLFFLLYEGTGAAKRLTDLCDDSDLEALWLLKQLRLGARHDVEHGTQNEILKKNKKIGYAYKTLTGTVLPKTKGDWIRAQLALYQQLHQMLDRIWLDDSSQDSS